MFAVFFDRRIVFRAQEWFAKNKPNLTPIYVRNRVRIYESVGGTLRFTPYHQNFILKDGEEIDLNLEDGWESNYSLCVNPAEWDKEDISLIVNTDPTIPGRVEKIMKKERNKLLKKKQEHACCVIFFGQRPGDGLKLRSKGAYNNGIIIVPDDPEQPIFYSSEAGGHAFSPAKIKKKGISGSNHVYQVTRLVLYDDCRVSEKKSLTEFISEVELFSRDEAYQCYSDKLREKISKAKAEATVECNLPEPKPIERGYPRPRMPGRLEISRPAGVLRTTCELGKRYEWQIRMAGALGYKCIQSSSSRTGRTKSSKWALPGAVSPKDIEENIEDFDPKNGIIYAKKENMGRVIGRNGSKIKLIQELTGRRWRVREVK